MSQHYSLKAGSARDATTGRESGMRCEPRPKHQCRMTRTTGPHTGALPACPWIASARTTPAVRAALGDVDADTPTVHSTSTNAEIAAGQAVALSVVWLRATILKRLDGVQWRISGVNVVSVLTVPLAG